MSEADAPIFVVGVARSGTTLLAAMLSAHPRLDCGPESRFFARYRHLDARARRRLLDPAEWPEPAVDLLASLRNQGHPVVELFGLTEAQVRAHLASRPPALATILEALTVLHAEQAGKPRWIEKTPRHLLMTDLLRRLWPQAPIVRIVRDPRDVAVSLSAMPFAKESVVGNLVRIDQDDRASRHRIAADPLAMTLRYEDLVSEPARELGRVCAFLGEAFEPGMLDARASAAGVVGAHEWWKESVSGPLTTTSVGRWRREMSADAQRFAALHLAGFIREHGYEDARDAMGELAVVPVADAVGPSNERLLVELARRDRVVARPAPTSPLELASQDDVVFLGVRGQLDPGRGRPPAGHILGAILLAGGLLWRRLRGRPVSWVRQATLRDREPRHPLELLVAGSLRLLAREVSLEQAWREHPWAD
jgi:sulfotransferase family protein